jgi:hypothetical protein
MRARTIRVVFAAKLLKKLVLHPLSLLSFPTVKAFAGTCAPSAGTQIGEIKKKNLISFFFNLTAASDRSVPAQGRQKKRILKKNRNRIVQKKNLTCACARSTIALLQKLQCPTDEFFRYHTQLQ